MSAFRITLKGFLAVRLIEFDYAGKRYHYHGRKLENALNRLLDKGGPQKATTAELVVWGQAVHDWKKQSENDKTECIPKFLFVGQRPSATAIKNGWTWKDGHLAAKQLFDALLTVGIVPLHQWYTNTSSAECDKLCQVARKVGLKIVGMGAHAQTWLNKNGYSHVALVHPAARGKIRKKELYQKHVAEQLGAVA